jgi:uncharacterized protein YdeI (YjbR/CyaY-like superfamily)
MAATFFPTPSDFRHWLVRHHDHADELWVGFYKKDSGRSIQFTPRRRGSHWSRVNLERVATLIEEGRMTQSGLQAYEARDPKKSGRYSFERDKAKLSEEQVAEFRTHSDAWTFWIAQPPGYRKQATWWVVSAKREDTRARRLAILIADSAEGLRIKQLRRG